MVTPCKGLPFTMQFASLATINVLPTSMLQVPSTVDKQKPAVNTATCPPMFFTETFKTVDAERLLPTANFTVTALRTTFFVSAYRQR